VSAILATSATSHRRIQRASAWLKDKAPAEEILIIGATLDGANELVRNLAKDKGGVFGWHRFSLAGLAATLATPLLAERKLTTLSRIGSEAIMTRVVHRTSEQAKLGRYEPVGDTPGFSRAVAAVIAELRLAYQTSGDITQVAPDLVPLKEGYEAALAEAGLVDWSQVLRFATEVASEGRKLSRLTGLPTVLLDVSITNEAELAFLKAVAGATSELLTLLPAADELTLTWIREALPCDVENLDSISQAGEESAGTVERLQRHLFNEQLTVSPVPADNEFEIFSAPGESRECVEIARRIVAVARTGVPFDRIAVLLRAPEGYRAHLQEAFTRASIPVHFARGAVRPDPSGRAFYSLLRCAVEGLSARRFAEYLSLAQVPDPANGGGPPAAGPWSERWVTPDLETAPEFTVAIAEETLVPLHADASSAGDTEAVVQEGQLRAPRRWERLLVEAAVIGGHDRWKRRIDGLIKDLNLRLGELEDSDEALVRTIKDLSTFAGYALPLIDELDRLPQSCDWGEWLDRLGALATRAIKNPDRVLSLLAELSPMASVGPVSLTEVLLALEGVLLQVAVPPAAQRYGKVFVAPIEAVRGLSFEVVFVPGLAEKMFPRKIVEEPILLDAMRQRLGGNLPTNRSRLEKERLALALAVGAASERICLSYPRLDLEQARGRVPSFYALEVVRAAEGWLPDFTELARRAETKTTAKLGWPAPRDPAEAIDDAEHDLAVLQTLVDQPEAHAGAARYLVTANPWLARALRARYQRWRRSWSPADGMISESNSVRAILTHHLLGARSYSATALQSYARCPYQFFLQAVHRLTPREMSEAIDELDPLQRGSLIHEVQFKLLASLQEAHLLPVRQNTLEPAWEQLDSVLSEVANHYRENLAPAIDRVWTDSIAAIRADLRQWLRRASEDNSGYIPWHFELSFGLENRLEPGETDPESVPGPVSLDCGIQLRGSIDLVERLPGIGLRITDHKTGRVSAEAGQVIDGGKTLQPVLYALAAEKLFSEEKVQSGRLYFCTSVGGFSEHVVALNEESRDMIKELADAVREGITKPFLPAAPEKSQCETCVYRIVCGPNEERRTARKVRVGLEGLSAVRSLP
jgi:ATP-dependent helicase/nuclease subunit B